jgi:hypothetical protein
MIFELPYNEKERVYLGYAITLGKLQAAIEIGEISHRSENANFVGDELRKLANDRNYDKIPRYGYFLKADCSGGGQFVHGRSRNRIIVCLDANHVLMENWALLWDHAETFKILGSGFFVKAIEERAMTKNLILAKRAKDMLGGRRR